MSIVSFEKYQGNGNDFVIVNNCELSEKQIQQFCNRNYGVGSDGFMNLFFENNVLNVKFYNPDGSESFCGNGSRCAIKYAAKNLGFKSGEKFSAFDGDHIAEINHDSVSIEMFVRSEIKAFDGFDFVNTGAPHAVKKVSDLEQLNIIESAKHIRYHDAFQPIGTNVNFYEEIEPNHIKIRTFEKGVEAETLACGTGVTACALVYKSNNVNANHIIKVDTLGGQLSVNTNDNNIYLTGGAEFVFKGEINLNG